MDHELNNEQRRAVCTWVAERLTLVLNNESAVKPRLDRAAATAVREGMGTGVGAEEYAAMLAGRGASGYERRDYALVVGIYVADELQEILDERMVGDDRVDLAYRLLADVTALTDNDQREMLGYYYLPESLADAGFDVVEDDE
jgi:hypothetical protein